MGRPKSFVEIGGRPLVERVLDSLARVCDRLLIVAAAEGPFAHLGLPVAIDEYPGSGPLAGIHAALKAVRCDSLGGTCLVAACDQPFLSPALLAALAERAGEGAPTPPASRAAPAVACRIGGRFLPFPAVYPAWALPLAEDRLLRGELRLMPFLEALCPLALEEPTCRALDPELLSFANLNRPEELEAARSIASGGIGGADPKGLTPATRMPSR